MFTVVIDASYGHEVHLCATRSDALEVADFYVWEDFDCLFSVDGPELFYDPDLEHSETDFFACPDEDVYITVHEVDAIEDIAAFKAAKRHADSCPCKDCDVGTLEDEFYSVHKQLWRAAGMDNGYLCIGCLEKRIGRELCSADFTHSMLNTPQGCKKSDRLADRLSRVA